MADELMAEEDMADGVLEVVAEEEDELFLSVAKDFGRE